VRFVVLPQALNTIAARAEAVKIAIFLDFIKVFPFLFVPRIRIVWRFARVRVQAL
jgi:hypothetical protein